MTNLEVRLRNSDEKYETSIQRIQHESANLVQIKDSEIAAQNDAILQLSAEVSDLRSQLSNQILVNDATSARLGEYTNQIGLVSELIDGKGDQNSEIDDIAASDELSMLQEKILTRLREESIKQEAQVSQIRDIAAENEERVSQVCLRVPTSYIAACRAFAEQKIDAGIGK